MTTRLALVIFAVALAVGPVALAGDPEVIRLIEKPVVLFPPEHTITVRIVAPATGDSDRDQEYIAAVTAAITEWGDYQKKWAKGYKVRIVGPAEPAEVTVTFKPEVFITVKEPGSGEKKVRAHGGAFIKGTRQLPRRTDTIQRYTSVTTEICLSTKVLAGPRAGQFRSADAIKRIMQHEFGHAEGLPDLYQDGSKDQLMYGFSTGDDGNLSAVDLDTDPSAKNGKSAIHGPVSPPVPDPRPPVPPRGGVKRVVRFSPGVQTYQYDHSLSFHDLDQASPETLTPIKTLGLRVGAEPTSVLAPGGWVSEFVLDLLEPDIEFNDRNGFLEPNEGIGWLFLTPTDSAYHLPLDNPIRFSIESLAAPSIFRGTDLYYAQADNTITFMHVPEPNPLLLAAMVLITGALCDRRASTRFRSRCIRSH